MRPSDVELGSKKGAYVFRICPEMAKIEEPLLHVRKNDEMVLDKMPQYRREKVVTMRINYLEGWIHHRSSVASLVLYSILIS